MPLLTVDQARERLDAHADPVLVASFKTAVREWRELLIASPAIVAALSQTTRANAIHDLVCRAVRTALVGRDDLRELKALGFFAIAASDDLIVRFKYVATGIPRNVATRRQELIAGQRYDASMMDALGAEGIPNAATIVTCGYTLSDDGEIRRVTVQCDYNKMTLWKFTIFGEPGASTSSFEVLPLDPTLAPEASVVVRSATQTVADDDSIAGEEL